MTLIPVQSDLKGRICYTKNYQRRGSGYGRVMAVLGDAEGNRYFDVYRAHPHAGRYIFPQKGEVHSHDEDGRPVIKFRTVVSVPRNQDKLEAKVIFLNRSGRSWGRDLRLRGAKQKAG